jgi:predicted nicotinamide N-methyase
VIANDIDRLAGVAIAMNAEANDVLVEASVADIVQENDDFDFASIDVVLAGDIYYDYDLAPRATAFLQRCRVAGSVVLLGDPGRAALPKQLLTRRREYLVPVSAESQYTAAAVRDDGHYVLATVWELEADQAAAR